MDSLYEILPYSIDVVCAAINDFTDTPISVIRRKPFISYLNSYINHFFKIIAEQENRLSILLERKYIDRSYLQDHSEYYVKCFNHYERDCMRIHFFNCSDSNLLAIEDFNSNNDETIISIQNAYLGFIVIRPIPTTFIARACLRRYENSQENNDHFIISRIVKTHVLGLEFSVETVPFIEQDRVLSVCATSALWSFFNAHKNVDKSKIPSPYQITTTAINTNAMTITVPNGSSGQMDSGLTIDMMCNCLKNMNLVPQFYELKKENISFFYELIHVFVSSGIPVILGLSVFAKEPEPNEKSKGLHAVVVLGDELGDVSNFPKKGFEFTTKSDYLSKLYIHDDRIGPYARLEYKNQCWNLPYDKQISKEIRKTEYYVPTDIVLGLYPKIRLPFATVWKFAYYLNENIKDLLEAHENGATDDKKIAQEEVSKIIWDFKLEDGSDLKCRIRKSAIINESKKRFLRRSLPHYCWVIKAYMVKALVFEIVLDATEVSQGKYVIDVLYCDKDAVPIFKGLENYFSEHIKTKGGDAFSDLLHHDLWALYKWFNPEPSVFNKLDYQFGETKISKYFKQNEYMNDEIKNQKPMIITSCEDAAKFELDKNKKYIWAISKDGFLLIGKEDENDASDFKGHPTLLQGRPGRIAGELYFENEKWVVNHKSGRYSYMYEDKEARRFVENVIQFRFQVFYPNLKFQYK